MQPLTCMFCNIEIYSNDFEDVECHLRLAHPAFCKRMDAWAEKLATQALQNHHRYMQDKRDEGYWLIPYATITPEELSLVKDVILDGDRKLVMIKKVR